MVEARKFIKWTLVLLVALYFMGALLFALVLSGSRLFGLIVNKDKIRFDTLNFVPHNFIERIVILSIEGAVFVCILYTLMKHDQWLPEVKKFAIGTLDFFLRLSNSKSDK